MHSYFISLKNILSLLFSFFFLAVQSQQYITVTSKSAQDLVNDFIGTQNASCITVSNVTVTGWQEYGNNPFSYGYFEKGTLPFDIEKGIILSTGNAQNAPGPNNKLLDDKDDQWLGDSDLAAALGDAPSNYLNATSLEFDFIANYTTGISFQYSFFSEEYRPTNCQYSDGFAFLIKKAGTTDPYTNIALVPGSLDPVTSLSINPSPNCTRNEQYFGGFNNESGGIYSPTAFDGQTKVLTASADIIPGEKYHIKLVIADHLAGSDRNGRYDSAVFLEAGSFVGKKDIGANLLLTSNTAICEGGTTVLDATTAGASNYKWFKDGINITTADNNPKFTVTTAGTYEVKLDVGGCQLRGSIKIEYSEKPLFVPNPPLFCNYNDGNPISLNLQNLKNQIISNYKDYFQVRYYNEENDAFAGNSNFIRDPFEYSTDTKIYMWVKSGSCAAEIREVNLLTPKRSLQLKDKTICPNATTSLTAETTFIYYKWLRENGEIIAEGPSLNFIDDVPVGKYSVELTSGNGCRLEQEVNVFASEILQITNVDITGNTATVFVTGGNAPYEYSLDNITFQSSNIFLNVPRGPHTVYVRDAQKCETVAKEFLIINLINVISPNGDGKNDVLDYSDLRIKKDVSIEIFDRYGTKVFKAQNKSYIWNGKMNGRALPTGNYWYILNWTEPDTEVPVSYKGWILLKNRN